MDKTKIEKKKTWWRKTLYFIGIDALYTNRWNANLRPRFFIIVLSILGFFFVMVLGVGKYSTSPSFCNSCHIMEPYYAAWEKSKHKHVACVDCHYPPGTPRTILWKKFQAVSQIVRYVTRTYSSKPFAEIEDTSCLRSGCHSTRLLKGRFISEKGIKFDHAAHLLEEKNERQLKCVTCHSQVVVGKHVEVTYDSCYLCHFKGRGTDRELRPLGGCLGCHELPEKSFKLGNMTFNHKKFVIDKGVACNDCHGEVVQGNGEAPQDRCFACHNQPEKLVRYGDIQFIHENHVTKHNVACFHCHQEIHHGFLHETQKSNMVDLDSLLKKSADTGTEKKEDRLPMLTFKCKHCHQGKHSGQLAIYSGKVSHLGLPDMPSPMYLAHVDCVGCHYAESKDDVNGNFNGTTFSASDKACVKCHDTKFKGIWEKTKKELKNTITKLTEKIENIHTAQKNSSLPESDQKEIVEKMKKAELWHNFILKAKGEHNIYLASWIIRQEDEILTEVTDKLKAEAVDLSKLPLVSGSYCSTLCHFKVGLKPKMKVEAFGKEMSHMAHSGLVSCTQCHNIGNHKEISLKKGVQETVCIKCHEK